MSSNSSQPTAPHDTAPQAPTGLQKLPMEMRLRIYKLLVVPRGSINVDTVPRPGSRTTTTSNAIRMRLADLWAASPDALSVIQTNKQLFREAADFLYAETAFKIASFSEFEMFLSEIGPANQAALTRLDLNLRIVDEDGIDNISLYDMLRGLTNLKSLTVAIDSQVLDVVAAQDDDLRFRFATRLDLQDDYWWNGESAEMAIRHMDYLRLFAWGLLGQAEDKAGKRERFKVLKITRSMGLTARLMARMRPGRVLESDDYDEIEATILAKIEVELEAGGWFE